MRVEDVQAFVRNVAEGVARRAEATWEVDRADVRHHFSLRLRSLPAWVATNRHALWADGLDELCDALERLPEHQLLRRTQEFARSVVDCTLGITIDDSLTALEAPRVLRMCLSEGVLTRRYALKNLLVDEEGQAVTALGRPLLSFPASDARRWLLTVETELSSGREDEWSLPLEALTLLLEGDFARFDLEHDILALPVSKRTAERMFTFGVLEKKWWMSGKPTEPYSVDLRPDLFSLVREVLEDGAWRAAIRAARADLLGTFVPAAKDSALQASQDQIRLMTHEVRNALVPTRHHLDSLLKSASGNEDRIAKARDGVVRTLQFVDEMVSTAEAMAERSMSIGLSELIERCLRSLEGRERVRVVEMPGRVEVAVDQVTRALANVVRNALQISAVTKVLLSARRLGTAVELRVDDDGPGVEPANHERIFEDGFTTREGGTGFGLAYARKAIRANRGSVRCEESDLGGARFVVTLPAQEDPR
jgi:signal transduction histidine kinase